jgi:CubicO group peptidase (beta-lactamase class C family)
MWEPSQLIDRAVDEGAFPGGQIVVGDQGRVVWQHAFGATSYEEGASPVTMDTVYDVASLTKPLVTTSLVLRLIEAGRLAFDTPAAAFVRELPPADPPIRVRDLLAHAAGFPAWRPFHEQARDRDEILRLAAATPLEHPPRTRSVYSDLGFIVLGFVVERAGGDRLDRLAERAIFAPLGLRATSFGDPTGGAAPTEPHVPPGVVHDENCRAAGGVLGHAGLFSTANDVSAIARALVASWHGERVPGGFVPELVRQAFAPAGVPGSTWRLGWDGPSQTGPSQTGPSQTGPSQAGDLWPRQGVGHMGFTGTSIWIDPPRRRWVVLLTNRVHPTRDNQRIRQVRPALHDAIVRALARGGP